VLRKRVAVLVAAAVMVLSMVAASAPVFAVPEACPGGEMQPGQSGERERAPISAPSGATPGSFIEDPTGLEHRNPESLDTGRGELCGEI
jgi:hypothetical protein